MLWAQDQKLPTQKGTAEELANMSEEDILKNKAELYVFQLTGYLGLSETQKEQIRPIALKRMQLLKKMEDEKAAKGRLSKEFMEMLRVETQKQLTEMTSYFTEEQKFKFHQMQKDNRKKIQDNKAKQ